MDAPQKPPASPERSAQLAALLSRVALGDQRAFADVYRQAGAHLREPLGTVKSRVRRGLERLRRCLDAAAVAG